MNNRGFDSGLPLKTMGTESGLEFLYLSEKLCLGTKFCLE